MMISPTSFAQVRVFRKALPGKNGKRILPAQVRSNAKAKEEAKPTECSPMFGTDDDEDDGPMCPLYYN